MYECEIDLISSNYGTWVNCKVLPNEIPDDGIYHNDGLDDGVYYLVFPAGSLKAGDGTTNKNEIRVPFWQTTLTVDVVTRQDKVITGVNVTDLYCSGSVASGTIYTPDYEYDTIIGEGTVNPYYFYKRGNYYVSVRLYVEYYDSSTGERAHNEIDLGGYIALKGFSSDFDIEYIRNGQNEVTDLILTFNDEKYMAHGDDRGAYITQGSRAGEIYLYPNGAERNKLYYSLDTPMATSGTHTLVLPKHNIVHTFIEDKYGYDYDYGYDVTNTEELSKQFEIEEIKTTAIDGITDDTTGSLYDAYNTQGIRMATGVTEAAANATLPAGIYILKSAAETKKINVK